MKIFLAIIIIIAGFISATAQAGGPISVTEAGVASIWDSPVTLHTEGGSCGSFSNSAMKTKVENNIAPWETVSGVDLEFFVNGTTITEDINENNFNSLFVDSASDAGLTDSINPVIYDDDGSIVAAIFGSGNEDAVLGFAGPDGFTSDLETIVDGQAFFNCRCLAGNEDCGSVEFTEADLDFTMLHEIGHMIGLDHSQVNRAVADDSANCKANVNDDCDGVPTMYPVSEDPAEQQTLERDDEVALAALYGPSVLASSFATVTLSLTDEDGLPLRCADVQAQTSDPTETIAVVSGIYAPNSDDDGDGYTDSDGECLGDCGAVILQGLSASDVTIKVVPIASRFVGGSSLSPCANGQISGIQAEMLATISSAQLSAGTTVALGTIQTLSSGGITEGTGDSTTDDDTTDDSDDDSSSGSVSCRLNRSAQSTPVLFLLAGFFLFGLIRCLPRVL